jgi:hypothetical protein
MTTETNLLRAAKLCRQLADTPTSGTQSVDRLLRAVAKRLEREADETGPKVQQSGDPLA